MEKEHVTALLDDIFYRFEAEYKTTLDALEGTIEEHYQWYYMNSFYDQQLSRKNI